MLAPAESENVVPPPFLLSQKMHYLAGSENVTVLLDQPAERGPPGPSNEAPSSALYSPSAPYVRRH